jgi:hypothetical protein
LNGPVLHRIEKPIFLFFLSTRTIRNAMPLSVDAFTAAVNFNVFPAKGVKRQLFAEWHLSESIVFIENPIGLKQTQQ